MVEDWKNPIREYGYEYGYLRVLNVAMYGTNRLHCRCRCGLVVRVQKSRLVAGDVVCCSWDRHPELVRPPRRGALKVIYRGAEMSLRDACKRAGITYGTALARVRRGDPWNVTPPPKLRGGHNKGDGKREALRAACKVAGVVPYGVALSRLSDGWTPQEAVWIPRHVTERRADSERDALAADWREYYKEG